MVYGLLHRRIRKRISRDNITTFNDLLNIARTVEPPFGSQPEVSEKNRENIIAVVHRNKKIREEKSLKLLQEN